MSRAARWVELAFALAMVAVPVVASFAAEPMHGWRRVVVLATASLALQHALPMLFAAWRRR